MEIDGFAIDGGSTASPSVGFIRASGGPCDFSGPLSDHRGVSPSVGVVMDAAVNGDDP